MRKSFLLFLVMLINLSGMFANDFLTIYNNNQALYKTSFDLTLKRGVHFYSYEQIPTGIITESVIFKAKDKNVLLFSQNFEYDLANSHKMIEKYIGKNIKLFTENELYEGTLIFYDSMNFGLLIKATNELNMISSAKVISVHLSEMPQDFYTKPTLRWELSAPKDAKYPVELSFLSNGLNWRATYNVVLDKNNFMLNSWVTINNTSGKDYENVTLKLIAGDVQTHVQGRGTRNKMYAMEDVAMASAPVFEERAFSDYRLYTLDKKADINNNQEKQLSLYPPKSVKYSRIYEYQVHQSAVDVIIGFKNSKNDGLGIPLPRGSINFYEIDEADKTEQFVGVSQINHTSLNQDVKLKIGTAFDILANTKVTNSQNFGRIRENSYEVSITNNKTETVTVDVIQINHSANYEITQSSINFDKKDAFTFTFKVSVPPSKTQSFTFTERIGN